MKIKIPKIVKPIDLGGYDEALAGQFVQVWVNPPLDVLQLHGRILDAGNATKESDLREWYAAIWSEGAEESRWTGGELRELEERDPALMAWMISQTWKAREAHIAGVKKG